MGENNIKKECVYALMLASLDEILEKNAPSKSEIDSIRKQREDIFWKDLSNCSHKRIEIPPRSYKGDYSDWDQMIKDQGEEEGL